MRYPAIPIATAVLIGLVLPCANVANAADEDPQDELARHSVVLNELEARDEGTALATEIGKAEAWIEQGRGIVDDRHAEDEFRHTMDRVAAMLVLVEALLDEAVADAEANAAQAAAHAVEEELAQITRSADALEAKKAELEEQVSS